MRLLTRAILAGVLLFPSIAPAAEIYDWSSTAASNNSAPPDGFPENMNYSEVNDAARELMAVVKRYVEAQDGTNTTTGTEPAYALTSGQSLSTGAAGRVHVWTAHATSTGSVTLNVDSAGAKNVVAASGVQLGAGAIVADGVYMTVEEGTNHRVIGALSSPGVGSTAGTTTDNTLARFDSTSGTVIQDTGVVVDDSDNVTGMATLTTTGDITVGADIELGNASDTTLARSSAGVVTIEGGEIYAAGGTDVPVADGGTGRSTATAYAVITGGTTGTGAHQSVSGVGSDGQVLTSTGAGAMPAWEDPTGVALPGANGLIIENNSSTPTTSLDIDAGKAVLLNSTNGPAIVENVNLTIDATGTGANGLDTGSLASDTWYYSYIIYNGTTTAGLLSASATAPTLPSGYTFSYRVGAIRTGGSATFVRVRQVGNRAQYTVVSGSTTPNVPIMDTGIAGSTTTPTWDAIAVEPFVPPTAVNIRGFAASTSGTDDFIAAPNNSYGNISSFTNPPPVQSQGTTGHTVALSFDFVLESSNIYWAANVSTVFIACLGWVDAVNAN